LSYDINYAPIAMEHLRALDARTRAIIVGEVERHLCHQPESPARNRKRLRPNPFAPWELRVGDLRVFYSVESEPAGDEAAKEGRVFVLAVGIKRGNRLWVGQEEFEI
jgi:mRNA-degrading endonuclease RelE of RelBE toxin-antitoxin system